LAGSAQQLVSLQLLAQRCPADTENRRSLGLVAVGVLHHGVEQRRLHLAQHQAVEFCGFVAVQISEIPFQDLAGEITQRPFAMTGQLGECFSLVLDA